MERIHWEKLASFLFCVLVGACALFLLCRYLLPILLPFLIAYLLALLVRAPARTLAKHLPLSPSVLSVLLLLLLILLGGTGLWFAVFYLGREALSLAERLLSDATLSPLLDRAHEWLTELFARFGMLGAEGTLPSLSSLLSKILSSAVARLPAFLASLLSSLPNLLFFALLVLVASIYFCTDHGNTEGWFRAHCPARVRTRLQELRTRGAVLLHRYLLAYLSLFLFTLAILFLGFLFIGIDHALLLALLISFADLLPVIGIGTVLLPWGLFLILSGEGGAGISLLVLYLIASVLRQLAEPRILGKSLGLHPLLTLFVSFAGLQLFGFWGLLLSPIAAILCKALLTKGDLH